METIRLWVTGLASAAVIGAVVLVLTPGGGAEKAVKTIVSVFLISSMLLPFVKGAELSLDTELPDEEEVIQNENGISEAMAEQFEVKLRETIENILSQKGIHTRSVSIDIKTNGDEISVEKVTVVIKKESANNLASAKEILENELQIKADVLLEGAEG
ncbi:MAG: stage III sporulation protein AF [Clostridia bacterium]|nr:stage III sporulation protein AF [Clostridia bacterium]